MTKLKWLLDSLAVRTVLLVLAVVAVAEVATFSLVIHHGKASHIGRTARYVTGQIRLLQTVLPGLDTEARAQLESTDPGEQWLRLRPDGPNVPSRVASFDFAQELAVDLTRQLGQNVELRIGPAEPRSALWIGFVAAGERWWLILPPPRFKPQGIPPDLWWKLGLALFLLMAIAGYFVRGIVGPLTRFGNAVSATGNGKPRPVTPEGPHEVRRLAKRHNTMVRQLAQSEAERREMLAGLTHDLRAPLARLRVRVALLENELDRTGLERDADDMERIVDQCLSFLRSEAREAASVPPIRLADAVSDEVARHRELGRPVEIHVTEEAASSEVAIERDSVRRLLDNLIGNAMQYGAPPIEVGLSTSDRASVTLSVADSGPGIRPEERARALEAFVQIDPARATDGSCGLGLAIVRRIVEHCGGTLALAEAPGGGLEVRMTLPSTPVSSETTASQSTRTPPDRE